MARKQKTIHYIYKTTCLVTNRYYIGMHSTSNLEDGYMGSGKRLRYSIRKYGVENHKKEILEFYETRELLIKREIEIVNELLINDELCMNLANGGTGGYGAKFLTKEQLSKGGKNAINKIHYTQWIINSEKNRKRFSKQIKKLWKIEKYKEKFLKNLDWTNKKHSKETKKKMSIAKKGKGVGKDNSQFGTCWITKNGTNKKIKKEELNKWLKQGWIKGRKIN